jgi:putative isomerase
MSSDYVAEAQALATLALAVNRTADAASLTSRAAAMRTRIASSLWDDVRGTFANRVLLNDSLSTHVSPTSFYALNARAATDDQAARMAEEWAFNQSRFCLSRSWPDGVRDDCFWGLPSISADDPAYPPLGYWRGFVWGPMHMLTYWSLREYNHVQAVSDARAQLAKQAGATGVTQWRLNRHVCENFSPWRNATECTGSFFYHWGALAPMLTLMEAGF